MYLARVIGRLVASQSYEGLARVPYQLIQPLDENGAPMGATLVACTAISSGPGDLVTYVDGREAALALEETFVPVDATILGFVEQATRLGEIIGREEAPA
ncbi:EutN/CcmL family microcompartment protein [Engelhardtia mirabilis]|uniref:Ethanolamine utilization protein EutN n=1 Tax=Engelhardtia mirabilis TaxID=2528011 RepID=A0A518BQ42_9BACT|nr:Ethanolamine utilization protein EutN [Planctomycetes bacterium Pla133]QDV03414.1 Ethanolamine utilization protein EutN [Planctomycetes bacterium Pla86]